MIRLYKNKCREKSVLAASKTFHSTAAKLIELTKIEREVHDVPLVLVETF